jgi:hypothetical protein
MSETSRALALVATPRVTTLVPATGGNRALVVPRLRVADRSRLNGDRLFQAVLRWTIPLWVFGALTPAVLYMLGRLVADRWPRSIGANLVVFAWLGIAVSQACAAFLVGLQLGTPLTGLGNALGFGVFGWVFGGLAIAAGAAHGLNNARVIRTTAWLGGFILILAAVAAVAVLAGRHALYLSPAPLGMLLPNIQTVKFYTTAAVFITEQTLGEKMPRLVLFFPWAPALGLGALAIFFISTVERSLLWRAIGMAGGLVGTVFSWSRIAIAALLAVSAVLAFMRAGLLARLAVVGLALVVFFTLPLFGIDLFSDLAGLRHSADAARAGSSMARDLIYQKSWEGFLQSPWIGHGWIGESVHPKEDLPIGSHSTVYGLLYTGGLPTFMAFVIAMTATLIMQLRRLLQAKSRADRVRLYTGMALTLCLIAYCPFEELFSLTLPCLFMFTFIGGCIGDSVAEVTEAPPLPAVVAPKPRYNTAFAARARETRALQPLRTRR